MRRSVAGLMLFVMVGLSLSVLAGCEEKFTRERWDMVKVGQYKKIDVKEVLGKPQHKPFDDLWWYYKGDNEAKIYYDSKGTVKAKKWTDTKKGKTITVPEGWIEK